MILSDKLPSTAGDIEDLMNESYEDFIGIWELVSQAERRIAGDAEVKAETLAMARMLLDRGLVAGNLTKDGGFAIWDQQQAEAVMDRIEQKWQALGHAPSIGDIVYFYRPCGGPEDWFPLRHKVVQRD